MEEKKYFTGGMNLDSDERVLGKDEYRYGLNIRNSNVEQGAVGSISMQEGTEAITGLGGISFGDGKRTIGMVDDQEKNRTIYIVASTSGVNAIYSYDYIEDKAYVVFDDQSNDLDLLPTDNITGIDISAGGEDTYIHLVTGRGEPKTINIDAGLRTWSPGLTEYVGDG